MNLLEKTRKLNEVLQSYNGLDINNLAIVMSEVENANVYCVNDVGLVLGYRQQPQCLSEDKFIVIDTDKYFPELYTRRLQNVIKTEIVVAAKEELPVVNTLVVPVYSGNKRLGSLVMEFMRKEIKNEDLVLAEFAGTVLGIAIAQHNAVVAEQKKMVRVAMENLSYTETNALKNVLRELEGMEGYLVASKIADKAGITRSVIVNAMRKLESAGVIETKSLGMKGTFIKVKVPLILEELNKV